MALLLYDPVPTCDGKWQVAVLDFKGNYCQVLPCVCETRSEAIKFANEYFQLGLH